ncbi:MAG: hypothetical protein Q9188_004059 [Gyalolechia gomerana]
MMSIRGSFLSIILLGWAHTVSCSPAVKPLSSSKDMTNLTGPVASIPSDFEIHPQFKFPIGFPPEACYVNIIAALREAALGDFNEEMRVANYRTTKFPQPIITIRSPEMEPIPRKFVVWGLFLIAFYMRLHRAFQLRFFSLHWKGKEVAGIGIGKPRTTGTMISDIPKVPSNRDIAVDYEFFGAQALGQDAVFMTIISALSEAAPPPADTRIQETWINFLNTEDCLFTVVPTEAARTTMKFTYQDLIQTLSKAAEFFLDRNTYQQLSMNVTFTGTKIAQAAFVLKPSSGVLDLSAVRLPDIGIT